MLMAESTLLYYITDRKSFPGDESAKRRLLLEKINEAVSQGVNYIQLREKDLPPRELELLAQEAMKIIRNLRTENRQLRTALLINSRTDVALAAAADGVHLTAHDVSPAEVRAAWAGSLRPSSPETLPQSPIVAVSCHTPEEVAQAASDGANFAVFAPVFEKLVLGKLVSAKPDAAIIPTGLDVLRQACRAKIPVLALGGITLRNAESCLQAGAAGIAAIRLFQENDMGTVVRQLRAH
jgi:thiamine-phosphate pyrophosphorylase